MKNNQHFRKELQLFCRYIMKKIMSFLIAIIACLLVGCATTTTTDTFRFQVRELKLTLGEEKSLDIIMGDFSDDEEVIAEQVNKTEDSGAVEVLETKSGLVKIKATVVGEVEFRAYIKSQPNVKDTITITVENEKIDYLKLESDKINEKTGKVEIKIDDEVKINVTSYPVIENIEYVWESSNEEIFTVDSKGNVTGTGVGSATLTVYEKNDPSFSITKEIVVDYLAAAYIETDKDTYEMRKGEEIKIITTAYNANGTTYGVNQKLSCTNSNSTKINTANIGEGYIIAKALQEGTYTITIKSGNASKKVTINILSVTEE